MRSSRSLPIARIAVLTGILGELASGQAQLILRVSGERQTLERCPWIAHVTLHNAGNISVVTAFSQEDSETLRQQTRFLLTSKTRQVHLLDYIGGSLACRTAPLSIHQIPPDAEVRHDIPVSLVIPTRETGVYNFLPPGDYTGQAEVLMPGGEKLISNQFQLIIAEAKEFDVKARDLMRFRHAGFLEGRDPPFDVTDYDGRRLHNKIDVSRFGELQKILEDHPDSTYAQWIRFWKLYYHGPWDQALTYAREHHEFPLSDNLMFWVAQKYFGQQEYDRSREALDELLRDFPDSDARARAVKLQEKLAKKPQESP